MKKKRVRVTANAEPTKPAMTLKPGDLVYRVREVDSPTLDDTPFSWEVVSTTVKTASDQQIALATYLPGLWNKRFPANALGVVFFASAESAVLHFLKTQTAAVDRAFRDIKTAERAIGWVKQLYPDLEVGRG